LINFQKPDEEIPLDKISCVDHLDDDSNSSYQFEVMIEGRRQWRLKAKSEARHYLTACINFVIVFGIFAKLLRRSAIAG
jgi:hypothetical protein